MNEKEAIEALKIQGGLEITGNAARVAKFFEGLIVAEESLEKQEKLKEKIAELTEKEKRHPWEEMFVGEIVKLLKEFVVEE